MSDRRYHIVLNPNSGTVLGMGLTPDKLKGLFEEAGLPVSIDADGEAPLSDRIQRALDSDADVIVAAGGDGTITALSEGLAGTDKTLAILPLGTVNLLARDLHLPLQLDQAIAALKDLEPRRIDVGELNGHVFLHKVVVGFIPGVAAGREKIRHRSDIAAKLGFLKYFLRRVARARRMAVVIEPEEGASRVERVQAIAVASNAYDEGLGMFFSRQRLDRGTLTLYVIKHFNLGDMLRLTTEMLVGRWQDDEALRIESVRAVTIRSRKQKLKVMLDGEVQTFDTPLNFTIRPLALSILAPLVPESAAETETESEAGLVAGI